MAATCAYAGRVSPDPRPASPHAHVCLAFDDPAGFRSAAAAFLAEGLAAGERLWYVASAPPVSLPGPARFVSVTDAYPGGTVVDPAAQAAEYAAATASALAEGYTGLRVVAEATPLVRTRAQLDAFTRYEHLADRLICDSAFAALCAYDRRVLGDDAIAQLATMHAGTNADVPFHLTACPPATGTAALAGELDLSAAALLAGALERAGLAAGRPEVALDAAGLRFTDHRSLVQLDDYAGRHGVTMVLRRAPAAVARLAGLLDLPRLRVEAAR
jgi:anti-anti-sigma regulatory factor